MAQPKQAYLIMLASDTRLCLGAREVAPAAPLELKPHDGGDQSLRWLFGTDGLIRPAFDTGMCVEVRAVSGGAGQACLASVMPGKLAQHWHHADGAIFSQLYPKLVLDNTDGRMVPGNPVRVCAHAGGAARQWSVRAVAPEEAG